MRRSRPRRWDGPIEPASPAGLAGAGVIIDALFGAGLDRPVEGIGARHDRGDECRAGEDHAVDLPSGINGTSGAVQGVAVNASETITFFRRKPGHLLLPGRLHCGEVHVADIGIGGERAGRGAGRRPSLNEPALWANTFPIPRIDGHKYSRGHAVVVSGGHCVDRGGAARGARRRCAPAPASSRIASPREALAVNAAASLAVMVRPVDGAAELDRLPVRPPAQRGGARTGRRGRARRCRRWCWRRLAGERAVVLDADALTSFCRATPGAARAPSGAPRRGHAC